MSNFGGAVSREDGYVGQLVSLAGVRGTPNKGRVIEFESVAPAVGAVFYVPSNPKRIALIIQTSPVAPGDGIISLANDVFGTGNIRIPPGGTFQIDSLFPWTGAVNIGAMVALTYIQIMEISVS